MGFALAVVLSFVPSLLCAGLLYWADRYEKQPKRLLGVVFVWGAFFATLVAVVTQVVLQTVTALATGSPTAADVAGATLFAPIIEEILKTAACFLVFVVLRPEFDSVLDGIVYAGAVALGFAATENALYLYAGYRANGGDGRLRSLCCGWCLGSGTTRSTRPSSA